MSDNERIELPAIIDEWSARQKAKKKTWKELMALLNDEPKKEKLPLRWWEWALIGGEIK